MQKSSFAKNETRWYLFVLLILILLFGNGRDFK
jgi:hypothetical protein